MACDKPRVQGRHGGRRLPWGQVGPPLEPRHLPLHADVAPALEVLRVRKAPWDAVAPHVARREVLEGREVRVIGQGARGHLERPSRWPNRAT